MALAAETLDELVRPDQRAEWNLVKLQWFPRTDTPEHAAYDKRTPGKQLFVAGTVLLVFIFLKSSLLNFRN